MIRTIIVDDERPARQRLRRLLEPESDIEVVAECGDGESAVAAVREHAPDLLLLDIQMPAADGFEVLDRLGADEQPPAVIFSTAYDDFAIRAFEACALDYLLKPTNRERLAQALERARHWLSSAAPDPVEDGGQAKGTGGSFLARSGGRVTPIAPDEIDWIEAAGNYAILHVGERGHMLRETMSAMTDRLDPAAFFRANRSAIVNLQRVRELRSYPGGKSYAVLESGEEVRVTAPLKELQARLTER